jgi:alpha-1,6-mannosyltransferase
MLWLPGVAGAIAGYKLLALAGLAAMAAGAAWLGRGQGIAPGWAAFLVVANPLSMWEVALNGHNDALMAGGMVLAVAAWLSGLRAAGVLTLGLGALVKFVAAVLAAPLAVDALRRGWGARLGSLAGGVGTLAVAVMLYQPFWDDGRVVEVLRARSGVVGISLPAVLAWLGDEATIAAWLGLLMSAFVVAAAVAGLVVLWLQWRGRLTLLAACGWLLLAVLGLGLSWFQSWYVLWLLPFAVVAGDRRLRWAMWTLAASSMATYLVFQYWALWRQSGVPFGYAQLAAWLVVWVPVVAAIVVAGRPRVRAETTSRPTPSEVVEQAAL